MNKIVLVLSRMFVLSTLAIRILPVSWYNAWSCSNDLAMFHFQTANNSDGSIFGVHVYAFA